MAGTQQPITAVNLNGFNAITWLWEVLNPSDFQIVSDPTKQTVLVEQTNTTVRDSHLRVTATDPSGCEQTNEAFIQYSN